MPAPFLHTLAHKYVSIPRYRQDSRTPHAHLLHPSSPVKAKGPRQTTLFLLGGDEAGLWRFEGAVGLEVLVGMFFGLLQVDRAIARPSVSRAVGATS